MLIKAGSGLQMTKKQSWVDGEEITICELSLDGIQENYPQHTLFGQSQSTSYNVANPGDILMIDEFGDATWVNPMKRFNDKDLRETYPALEDAWQNLMTALHEYELAKKLVQDYDG